MSIFLCTKNSQEPSCSGPASEAEKQQLQTDLEAMSPLVENVYFETSQEAFTRFQEQFKGSLIADSATPEDLGESFRVKLSDPDQYAVITSAFTGRPGIERVDDQKQVLDKLFRLLDGLQMISMAIAIAMLLVTVLLVGNTMRLAAYSRRRETGIMRLVGASVLHPAPLPARIGDLCPLGAALAVAAIVGIKIMLVDRFLEPNFRVHPVRGLGHCLGGLGDPGRDRRPARRALRGRHAAPLPEGLTPESDIADPSARRSRIVAMRR